MVCTSRPGKGTFGVLLCCAELSVGLVGHLEEDGGLWEGRGTAAAPAFGWAVELTSGEEATGSFGWAEDIPRPAVRYVRAGLLGSLLPGKSCSSLILAALCVSRDLTETFENL